MRRLLELRPVRHALIWIGAYLVLFNVGEALADTVGVDGLATAVLLLGFSALLLVYLRDTGRRAEVGLQLPRKNAVGRVALYVPIALLAVLQLVKGVDPATDASRLAVVVALMVGVAFVEELLFRGFLFRAIARRSGVTQAVVISGITFGLGHVINLLRGAAVAETVLQMAAAVAIGLVLAQLVALTGSLLPGIVFHAVFNVVGSITRVDPAVDGYLLAIVLVVCTAYALYLGRPTRRHIGVSPVQP